MKLVLLRHGESQWNLENKFTGWTDVSLTKNGIKEAEFAAHQILKKNINVDSIFTSLLSRAIATTEIVAKIINFKKMNIKYDWRLNERHYGALQGLNKSETAAKYGENQVKIWRRSYDTPPPLINTDDKRHPRFNKKFRSIHSPLPLGESLKDVIERLEPFWTHYIGNILDKEGNHLIVAHSNSLRAIIKILDNLSKEKIMSVNVPTGVPLLYQFDSNGKVIKKEYLIENSELKNKQQQIKNQGKAQ
jgi:2,3-bisphosphoglycerate-dependent phosphoglycerate mutase